MSWDAVSAVGEAVSAIAVVVSLLYLAVQVRQSNQQAEASAETDWMAGINVAVKGMAEDREIVATMRKGLSDFTALPNDEKVIFSAAHGGVDEPMGARTYPLQAGSL